MEKPTWNTCFCGEGTFMSDANAHLDPERDLLVTGTDAVILHDPVDTIMKIHRRWQEKLRLIEKPDLSNNLAVNIGTALEPVIAKHLELRHGETLTSRQLFVKH